MVGQDWVPIPAWGHPGVISDACVPRERLWVGCGSSRTARAMGDVDGGTEVTEGGWGTVGGWALLPGPSPPYWGCLCPQEAYESAVEYFGENPKNSPPTTFFPMFMRFIRAYKVGSWGCPGSGGWEGTWFLGGSLTPLWGNWPQPHTRLGACGTERPWHTELPFGAGAGTGLG